MPFELTPSESEAVTKMKTRLSGFETEEDIIITTSPKAGTTWLQQICHQLRAGKNGDMTFQEISEVVPFMELAYDQGQDLTAKQFGAEVGLPRCFKTHAWEPHCPKGAKYIVVVREPKDVALSFYRFFEGWFFEPGEVPMDAFVEQFWLARGVPESKMQNAGFYDHFLSWYHRRHDQDVLFLFFEDLKENLQREVEKVARFMSEGTAHDFTDAENIRGAVHRSSFAFMSEYKGHFDEKLSKLARNETCGLAPDAGLAYSKIRDGKSGDGKKALSDELKSLIDQRWQTQMLPATGFESYDALRAACGAEHK